MIWEAWNSTFFDIAAAFQQASIEFRGKSF
jgi:hypothetical protein